MALIFFEQQRKQSFSTVSAINSQSPASSERLDNIAKRSFSDSQINPSLIVRTYVRIPGFSGLLKPLWSSPSYDMINRDYKNAFFVFAP